MLRLSAPRYSEKMFLKNHFRFQNEIEGTQDEQEKRRFAPRKSLVFSESIYLPKENFEFSLKFLTFSTKEIAVFRPILHFKGNPQIE